MSEIWAWTRLTAWFWMTKSQSLASRPSTTVGFSSGSFWPGVPPLRTRSDAMSPPERRARVGNVPRFYSRPGGGARTLAARAGRARWPGPPGHRLAVALEQHRQRILQVVLEPVPE